MVNLPTSDRYMLLSQHIRRVPCIFWSDVIASSKQAKPGRDRNERTHKHTHAHVQAHTHAHTLRKRDLLFKGLKRQPKLWELDVCIPEKKQTTPRWSHHSAPWATQQCVSEPEPVWSCVPGSRAGETKADTESWRQEGKTGRGSWAWSIPALASQRPLWMQKFHRAQYSRLN